MSIQMILTALTIAIVTFMFFSPRFPNAVTATIGAIAVSLIGVVPFKSVFNSYAGTSIVLMCGMMVVGGGMFHTGFAGWLGNMIVKKTGKNERGLQIAAILGAAVLSTFCNGNAAVMILYPIFSSVCLAAHVSMSRIMLPMFIGINYGTFMSLAGSGMAPATSSILMDAGYEGWSFFAPTTVGLPRAIISFVLMLLFMNKILPDTFVLPDVAEAAKAKDLPEKLTGKMIVSGVIMVASVVGMVINSPVCPMHICAAIGAVASVLTGCLSQKQMFASIDWGAVFMIGGMTAVASGVAASGLGDVIANGVFALGGGKASKFTIMMILLLTTGLITQFMSNNSAATLMAPIGIAVAESMGTDPHAFVMACLFGSGVAALTPMATPVLAFIMEGGKYSAKDLFKMGLLSLISGIIASAIFIPLFWK